MPTIETQMTEIQEMDLPALRDAWRRLRALAQAFAETGRVAPGNGTALSR